MPLNNSDVKQNLQNVIAKYLQSRGVEGFEFGGLGMTGPELIIENCTPEMSKRLQDACSDALISRGGGGMGGSYAYRQIDPAKFSDPSIRAKEMLDVFEANGSLPMLNNFNLKIDESGNLVGPSGSVIHRADARTLAMRAWVAVNQDEMMKALEEREQEASSQRMR